MKNVRTPLHMTKAARASERKDPLAEEFLRYLAVERNASSRTIKAYRQALATFRAETETPWKKCTADDFRDYLFALMKRGQARSYVRLQFSAFRTFYQFLTARKGLRSNPVREVQLPKLDKKLPLVLTRQQVEELLAAPARVAKNRAAPVWMPLRDVAIMELFYSSGLRLSELAALDVRLLISTRNRCACSAKAERNAFVRSVCRRWRRSRVIVQRRMYIQGRYSSANRAGECPRARSGSF